MEKRFPRGVSLDKRKSEIPDDHGFARLFIYHREPRRVAIIPRRVEIASVGRTKSVDDERKQL